MLSEDGRITIANVDSYRHLKDVVLEVPGYGDVRGDVAWGGNWFFLINDQGPAIKQSAIEELIAFTSAVRKALDSSTLRGEGGELIDHVEVFGPPEEGITADSQNFVLCPGRAYDRSPCGTGTCAKLACLAADEELAEGSLYRQAGILGGVFEGRYQRLDEKKITPIVSGQAYVTAESELILRPDDPYRFGSNTNKF